MSIFIIFLAILCVMATLLPLIPSSRWYIRGFDFPYAQISFLTAGSLLYLLFFEPLNWPLITLYLVLLLCFIYQIRSIYPYTPIAPTQVKLYKGNSNNTLSLLACNVYMDNLQVDRCIKLIENHNPDIVLLVETNEWWYEQTKQLQSRYPHNAAHPLDNTYGMILYSKLPMTETKIRFLVEKNVPSISTWVTLKNDIRANIYCLHPAPPSPTENETAQERDAELLLVAKEVRNKDYPVVVMGDLNDVAWSKTTRLFQKVSGLLDPRMGRGFFNTFPVAFPMLRWPLDHVFHTNHFKLKQIKRCEDIGSDHFPIYINLAYDWRGPLHQDPLEMDHQDLELAKQKIEEGLSD